MTGSRVFQFESQPIQTIICRLKQKSSDPEMLYRSHGVAFGLRSFVRSTAGQGF